MSPEKHSPWFDPEEREKAVIEADRSFSVRAEDSPQPLAENILDRVLPPTEEDSNHNEEQSK